MSRVIKPYGIRRRWTIFLLILGFVMLLISLVYLFPDLGCNNISHVALSLCIIISCWMQLKLDNYYVEWFDDELHYYMPKCKKTVKIKYSDITDVEIKLAEIDIHTSSGVYTLYLDNLMTEDMLDIKERISKLAKK